MTPKIQYKLSTFLYELRNQYPSGVTTMGPCSSGCGNSARGGYTCKDCLTIGIKQLGCDSNQVDLLNQKRQSLLDLQTEIADIEESLFKG